MAANLLGDWTDAVTSPKPSAARTPRNAKRKHRTTPPSLENLNGVRRRIGDSLVEPFTLAGAEVAQANALAAEIEDELYEYVEGKIDQGEYVQKARSLKANLRNNAELAKAVMAAEIPAATLVTMTKEELAPKNVAAKREALKQNYLKEYEYEEKEQSTRLVKTKKGEMYVSAQEENVNQGAVRQDSERPAETGNEWLTTAAAATVQNEEQDGDTDYIVRGASPVRESSASHDNDLHLSESMSSITQDSAVYNPAHTSTSEPTSHQLSVKAATTGPMVWKGSLVGEGVNCFASARHIMGRNLGEALPSELKVLGFAKLSKVEQYLSTRPVRCIMILEPSLEAAAAAYAHLRDDMTARRSVAVMLDKPGLLVYCVPPSNLLSNLTGGAVFKQIVGAGNGVMALVLLCAENFDIEKWKLENEIVTDPYPLDDDFDEEGSRKKLRQVTIKPGSIPGVGTCTVTVRLISGANELMNMLPAEVVLAGRTGIDDVLDYAMRVRGVPQTACAVLELEPVGENSDEPYALLCSTLESSQKAAVMLQLTDRVIYLLPAGAKALSLCDDPSQASGDMLMACIIAAVK